jgi:hypothetical protein
MTVPSTNVKFSDIYAEANGGYTSGLLSLVTMSFFSYFAGPNGSNSQADNNYGQGEGSGANRILGTTAKTTNIAVGDFDGLTYFYDNSTFQVTLNVTNNLTNPPPIPPPPVDNAVNVNVELWDSGFSYQYLAGGGMAMAPGTYGPSAVSQPFGDPIIFRGYWVVVISGANPSFAGGTCDIVINGTTKVSGGSLSGGSGPNSFDSSVYGTEDVQAYGGYTGLYFDVTVY